MTCVSSGARGRHAAAEHAGSAPAAVTAQFCGGSGPPLSTPGQRCSGAGLPSPGGGVRAAGRACLDGASAVLRLEFAAAPWHWPGGGVRARARCDTDPLCATRLAKQNERCCCS